MLINIDYLVKKYNDKYSGSFTNEQKELFENISSTDEEKQIYVFFFLDLNLKLH